MLSCAAWMMLGSFCVNEEIVSQPGQEGFIKPPKVDHVPWVGT